MCINIVGASAETREPMMSASDPLARRRRSEASDRRIADGSRTGLTKGTYIIMATATETKPASTLPLEYKGKPLRRKDNLIYYGSMADEYIIMMQITDTVASGDLEIPTRISVQLQLTDPELKSKDRVVKDTVKNGFYEAIDVAAVWLDRALAGKVR